MAKILDISNFHEFFNSCALGKADDFMALLKNANGIIIIPTNISHLLKGCELLQSLVDRGLVYLSVNGSLITCWKDFMSCTLDFTKADRTIIYLKEA